MPLPGFVSSLAGKAQSFAQSTPLAGHIPGAHQTHTQAQEGPTANEAAAQGGYSSKGNHTLGVLHHQLRQFGQQYSSASPVQKIITTSKGVSIDYDSLGRDAKAQSKELYTWGQQDDEDIKDVTDRLAFMNYVQGSLATTLAVSLDEARTPLKELRDAENQLAPRRSARTNLETQIAKIEHNQDAKSQARLAELREQLQKANEDDDPLEKEILVLKRKAVRESETAKWTAIREYAEKLVLVAQSATIVASALPAVPPTPNQPYTGSGKTAGARASLQRALDNYRTGHIHLPSHEDSILSHASSTASFGETHEAELRDLDTADATHAAQPSFPLTPPFNAPTHPQSLNNLPPAPQTTQPTAHAPPMPVPVVAGSQRAASPPSPVINPALLNQSPAPLPSSPPAFAHAAINASPLAVAAETPSKLPSITPIVAETGIPVSAADPGPASGSLKDLHKDTSRDFGAGAAVPTANIPPAAPLPPAAAAPAPYESAEDEKRRLEREDRERVLSGFGTFGGPSAQPPQPKYESAEDEKRRLEREERERILAGPSGASAQPARPQYESAEDEKKRLEREERERILAGNQSSQQQPHQGGGGDSDDLPPYQEPTLL